MKKRDPHKQFKLYLDRLFEEVFHIDSKFELYYHLLERKYNRLQAMNISPAFFQLIMDALLTDSIISLSRLYDSYKSIKRSDRNLIRFLNFVESNIDIFPSDKETLMRHNCDYIVDKNLIDSHRAKINEMTPILDNLFTWRDKYVAHFDKTYFSNGERLKEDASIKFGEIRGLISLADEILNSYSAVYDGNVNMIRATNLFDVDKSLDILNDCLIKTTK